jgi:hypothetical protein
MRIPPPLLGLSIPLTLLLAGCGSTDYTDHQFGSISELSEAAEDAGLDCGDRIFDPRSDEALEEELASKGWAQDGYGRSCVVMLFDSDAKRDEVIATSLEEGEAFLTGGNWGINGGQYPVEAVAEKMGGELHLG